MVLPLTLITGASSGIGYNLTKLLSSENHLILAVSRSIAQVKEFQNNKNIICCPLDLSDEKNIVKIPAQLGIKYKVKNLINCAAILNVQNNLIDYSYEELNHLFKLNTIAPVFIISTLLKNNCFLDRSRILNMSTKAAHVPVRKLYGYCMTKSALYMSYLCFKKELCQKGIYVGSMKPGVVATKMIEEMKEKGAKLTEKDLLQPKTVANFIKYLISNEISDEKFSEEEWDIYHRSHHAKWNLTNDYIPLDGPKINFN